MTNAENPVLFLFDDSPEGRVLLPEGDSLEGLPHPDDIRALADLVGMIGRVSRGDDDCDAWGLLDPKAAVPPGFVLTSRRDIPHRFGYGLFNRSGIAYQMMNLYRRNQFCGVCGAEMQDHALDRARECAVCGNVAYPVLSPAVIVAVEKDGMLLMGHGIHFPAGRYSVLAGFVEPGETLEEAVAREIYEEARVKVRDIRYFGSQPWPFPNSMMFGFRAEWESGDPVPGDGELSDVRWFTSSDLPDMPPSISISRTLIDDWLRRQNGN